MEVGVTALYSPIVYHQFLDSYEGLKSDIRVLVGQVLHYHLFPSQLFYHTEEKNGIKLGFVNQN